MILFLRKKPFEISSELLAEYRDLCQRLARVFQAAGFFIRSHNDEEFERLRAHSKPVVIVNALRVATESYEDAMNAGESVRDDRKIIWRFLQRSGLRPSADGMDRLKDGSTMTIYSVDNVIIFFNFEFFKYIHATVDEVFTINWPRDSQRSTSITAEALRLVFLVKTRMLRNSFQIKSIPKHRATFTFSGVRQMIEVDLKSCVPLFSKTGMAAYLIIQDTKRIDIEATAPVGPV